jgi:hypothetical protein
VLPELEERLVPELRGGDDRDLWTDAATRLAEEIAAFDTTLASPPRHVVLTLAKTRKHRPGIHPDQHAAFTLAWERDRGDAEWRFAGERAHVKRRRGVFDATLCLPAGTAQLAWHDALVLWRPTLPWAPQHDEGRDEHAPAVHHETGREYLRYRRDAQARWVFLGTRLE